MDSKQEIQLSMLMLLMQLNLCDNEQAIILGEGHEPRWYETSSIITGIFFNFMIVKMKGSKINHLKTKI